jgi:aminoglycoside phosphotransferase (APT) family kinase protein
LHLRAAGFTGAPAFLGTDGEGRDVLEHLPGDVAGQQPEPWAADDALLPTIGTLLRDLHTAATGFEPPAGTLWFRDEHPDPPERAAALGPTTVIGHNDATPQNVVVRAGRAVALIDFDLAGPSTPLREVLIACLHWAPLAEPSDRLVSFADCDAPARCRLLADGYGLVRADRERFVDLAVTSSQVSWHRMREAAELRGGGWARMWAEGVGDVIRRREAWLLRHRDELNHALLRE